MALTIVGPILIAYGTPAQQQRLGRTAVFQHIQAIGQHRGSRVGLVAFPQGSGQYRGLRRFTGTLTAGEAGPMEFHCITGPIGSTKAFTSSRLSMLSSKTTMPLTAPSVPGTATIGGGLMRSRSKA